MSWVAALGIAILIAIVIIGLISVILLIGNKKGGLFYSGTPTTTAEVFDYLFIVAILPSIYGAYRIFNDVFINSIYNSI